MGLDVISLIFDLTLMGIIPTSYDVDLMFYFVYWSLYPTTHKNDDLFDILGVIQMHVFKAYDFMCWAWTPRHIFDDIVRIINPSLSNLVICLNQESCLNWESIQSIYRH